MSGQEPVASMSLAALFGEGPFTRLDGFDEVLARERSEPREAPVFTPETE